MIFFIVLVILTSCSFISLAQTDTLVKESPLQFNASYVGEVISNLAGGIKQGSAYQGKANFQVTFDTKKARLWNGGSFYINGAHTHGGNPSAQFIGDFQGVSNIEADNLTYFHEMWYKQSFKKISFTLGLQDLNAEFASSENASLFFNSSFGVHSTIADNIIAPIFPLTAFGLQMQYDISPNWTAKVISFDGFPDVFSDHNPYNLVWRFEKEDGLLNVGEVTYRTIEKDKTVGTYSFGGYSHNHVVPDGTGTDNKWSVTNYGFYMVADKNLASLKNGSSLNGFMQASVSPHQENENWYYIGLGASLSGVCMNNKSYVVGLAMAHAGFDNHRGSETTLELTYKAQLTDQLFIQPNIQYVINPSGTDQTLPNALVTGLRFGIEL